MADETAAGLGQTGAGAVRARAFWTRRQIFVLLMFMLIMVSSYLDRLIMAILQEPIKVDMGLSDLQLGLLTGPAFGVLFSLSALPIARLAERFNRVTILSVSLTIWSVMTALGAAVSTFMQFLLSRMGVGVAEGGSTPSIHALVAEYFVARQRGLAMAVLGISMPIAGVLAPILGAFIAHHYGWRRALLVAGAAGVIIAAVFSLTVRDPRLHGGKSTTESGTVAHRPSFVADMKWLLGNATFCVLFIATALSAVFMTATLLFTASFLIRRFGMTLQSAGFVLSASQGGAGLVGAVLGGYLADRLAGASGRSYPLVLAVAVLGSGVLYYAAYSASFWPVASGLVIAATIFTNMKNGPVYAVVQNLVPDHMRATAAAVLLLAVNLIGGSVGPPLVGLLSDYIARGTFPAELGSFSAVCQHLPAGSAGDVARACAAASAGGLEGALKIMSVCFIVPAALFAFAARGIKLRLD